MYVSSSCWKQQNVCPMFGFPPSSGLWSYWKLRRRMVLVAAVWGVWGLASRMWQSSGVSRPCGSLVEMGSSSSDALGRSRMRGPGAVPREGPEESCPDHVSDSDRLGDRRNCCPRSRDRPHRSPEPLASACHEGGLPDAALPRYVSKREFWM